MSNCPVLVEDGDELVEVNEYHVPSGVWAAGPPTESLSVTLARDRLTGQSRALHSSRSLITLARVHSQLCRLRWRSRCRWCRLSGLAAWVWQCGRSKTRCGSDNDQDVDAFDRAIWDLQFGDAAEDSADFGAILDVDGADFVAWQRGFNMEFNSSDLAGWQSVQRPRPEPDIVEMHAPLQRAGLPT